jgi:S1-C subfamily serine protease
LVAKNGSKIRPWTSMKRATLVLMALLLVAGVASADGNRDRGYLGAAIAYLEKIDGTTSGLYIDRLIAGAAGERAGLQAGDRYDLTIERDGVEQVVHVELGELPKKEVYKWAVVMDENRPFFGVESGALIEGVVDGSPAATAGFEAGDVVVAIQGEPLTRNEQLHHLLASASPGDQVEIEIRRRGGPMTLFVTAGAAKDFKSRMHEHHMEGHDAHFGEYVERVKIKHKHKIKQERED